MINERSDPSRLRLRLPKSRRLRLRRDFQRVYAYRCTVSDEMLVIYADRNALDHPRLGLSVSRRRGNAVRRNRIKRLIREAFRLMQHEIPGGIDLIVVVRQSEGVAFATVRDALAKLIPQVVRRLEKRDGKRSPE